LEPRGIRTSNAKYMFKVKGTGEVHEN